MNLAFAHGLLSGGGKLLQLFQGILTELGPALAVLGPDVTQLLSDANKTLSDLVAIIEKIKASVVADSPPPAA